MKCPKCKKDMAQFRIGVFKTIESFICFNEKCVFYGIRRLNEDWFPKKKK